MLGEKVQIMTENKKNEKEVDEMKKKKEVRIFGFSSRQSQSGWINKDFILHLQKKFQITEQTFIDLQKEYFIHYFTQLTSSSSSLLSFLFNKPKKNKVERMLIEMIFAGFSLSQISVKQLIYSAILKKIENYILKSRITIFKSRVMMVLPDFLHSLLPNQIYLEISNNHIGMNSFASVGVLFGPLLLSFFSPKSPNPSLFDNNTNNNDENNNINNDEDNGKDNKENCKKGLNLKRNVKIVEAMKIEKYFGYCDCLIVSDNLYQKIESFKQVDQRYAFVCWEPRLFPSSLLHSITDNNNNDNNSNNNIDEIEEVNEERDNGNENNNNNNCDTEIDNDNNRDSKEDNNEDNHNDINIIVSDNENKNREENDKSNEEILIEKEVNKEVGDFTSHSCDVSVDVNQNEENNDAGNNNNNKLTENNENKIRDESKEENNNNNDNNNIDKNAEKNEQIEKEISSPNSFDDIQESNNEFGFIDINNENIIENINDNITDKIIDKIIDNINDNIKSSPSSPLDTNNNNNINVNYNNEEDQKMGENDNENSIENNSENNSGNYSENSIDNFVDVNNNESDEMIVDDNEKLIENIIVDNNNNNNNINMGEEKRSEDLDCNNILRATIGDNSNEETATQNNEINNNINIDNNDDNIQNNVNNSLIDNENEEKDPIKLTDIQTMMIDYFIEKISSNDCLLNQFLISNENYSNDELLQKLFQCETLFAYFHEVVGPGWLDYKSSEMDKDLVLSDIPKVLMKIARSLVLEFLNYQERARREFEDDYYIQMEIIERKLREKYLKCCNSYWDSVLLASAIYYASFSINITWNGLLLPWMICGERLVRIKADTANKSANVLQSEKSLTITRQFWNRLKFNLFTNNKPSHLN